MLQSPVPRLPALDRFYYLTNFQTVLDWVGTRYCHLLNDEEREFIAAFPTLPQPARALLVRMIMRKGPVFRLSKLRYEEIGCPFSAARLLAATGWIDAQPMLSIGQLFALLTKAEVSSALGLPSSIAALKKADQLAALQPLFPADRSFASWAPGIDDSVVELRMSALCERFKLLFFGNCRQDWSDFVLADLGIYRYEPIDLSQAASNFGTRADVDDYLLLHDCRTRLELGESASEIHREIPRQALQNEWLESRRTRLLFALAQQLERDDELALAADIYSAVAYPGARARLIRVFERLGRFDEAYALACAAEDAPQNEGERQQLDRMLPRLRRQLGLPRLPRREALPIPRIDLCLPFPSESCTVELAAAQHLASPEAPVYYVENTLITSLFGLLCWKAVFSPVPGAFFHPFQSGPADLLHADFQVRRAKHFAECLAQLDCSAYRETIMQHFAEKAGIQSPFVVWELLDHDLMQTALDCIPAAHLKLWFARILQDIKANRAGFPDLIQFRPEQGTYRLIEVKGPGDRLQDNQIRLLDFCLIHQMPVAVCYVQWELQE